MKKYKVYACLEDTDIIEAENEEEAFINFSNDLMTGGSWQYTVEEVEEDDEE